LIIITSTPRSYPHVASATIKLGPLGRRHLHRTCSNNNNTINHCYKYVIRKTFCSRISFRVDFIPRETAETSGIRCAIDTPHRTLRFGNQLLRIALVMLKTPVPLSRVHQTFDKRR
jgi:hypothetical protein